MCPLIECTAINCKFDELFRLSFSLNNIRATIKTIGLKVYRSVNYAACPEGNLCIISFTELRENVLTVYRYISI